MKPTNTSESGGANEVIHGMATLSINPSQPPAIIMHPRPGVDVAVHSALSDPEPSTMHTQSSPLRPSTLTTKATIPGTSSSPAGPKINITFIHPSRTQEAEHFPHIRPHPHPFPGHYKTHRYNPMSQAARNRLSQSHPPATASHTRNRHQALMRMGDIDHPLPKHIRNRMKLEQMREHRRDLIARLRAVEARIDAYQRLSAP